MTVMPEAEIAADRARELLARERERIEEALADLERTRRNDQEEIETATDPADDAEVLESGTVDDALTGQLRRELAAVERAEARLAEGTYGLSIESGEPIPAERLEAIPWAERTAAEQERFDRRGGR